MNNRLLNLKKKSQNLLNQIINLRLLITIKKELDKQEQQAPENKVEEKPKNSEVTEKPDEQHLP